MLFCTHPFILCEQGNEEEVTASEQEACTPLRFSAAVIHRVPRIVCLHSCLLTSAPTVRELCFPTSVRPGRVTQFKSRVSTFWFARVCMSRCDSSLALAGGVCEENRCKGDCREYCHDTRRTVRHKHPDVLSLWPHLAMGSVCFYSLVTPA